MVDLFLLHLPGFIAQFELLEPSFNLGDCFLTEKLIGIAKRLDGLPAFA
jgi:hypothetical protein